MRKRCGSYDKAFGNKECVNLSDNFLKQAFMLQGYFLCNVIQKFNYILLVEE